MPRFTSDYGFYGRTTLKGRSKGLFVVSDASRTDEHLETYERKLVPNSTPDFQVFMVEPGEDYRPDLISYRAYGTPFLWWAILEFNDVFSAFDVVSGMILKAPSLTHLAKVGAL